MCNYGVGAVRICEDRDRRGIRILGGLMKSGHPM
jgi:hypothetical protein